MSIISQKENILDIPSKVIQTICVFWIVQRIQSYRIWFPEGRQYPVVPIFEIFENYPPIVQNILFCTSMACMLFLIFKPKIPEIQLVLIITVVISAILEMASWQPWEYQFLSMIIVVIISRKNTSAMYTALLLIMASIYFYSGVQKINGAFLHSVWKGLLLKKFFGLVDINIYLYYSGLSLAILEGILGLGLLFSKFRKKAAYLLIAMHIFILVFITSVIGFSTVLPWNVAMIVLLHFLFIKNIYIFNPKYLITPKLGAYLILWGIMPATSFIGYWEQHFSSNLYTGTYKHLSICLEKDKFPSELKKYSISNICCNEKIIPLSRWAVREMTVMPPSSEWYGRKFIRQFQKRYPKSKYFILKYPFKECKEFK